MQEDFTQPYRQRVWPAILLALPSCVAMAAIVIRPQSALVVPLVLGGLVITALGVMDVYRRLGDGNPAETAVFHQSLAAREEETAGALRDAVSNLGETLMPQPRARGRRADAGSCLE